MVEPELIVMVLVTFTVLAVKRDEPDRLRLLADRVFVEAKVKVESVRLRSAGIAVVPVVDKITALLVRLTEPENEMLLALIVELVKVRSEGTERLPLVRVKVHSSILLLTPMLFTAVMFPVMVIFEFLMVKLSMV